MDMTNEEREQRKCDLWEEIVDLFPNAPLKEYFSGLGVNTNLPYHVLASCHKACLNTMHTQTSEDQPMPTDDYSIELEKAAIAARIRYLYPGTYDDAITGQHGAAGRYAAFILSDMDYYFTRIDTPISNT